MDEVNDIELEHEDAPENQAHEKLLAKIEKLKAELEKTKAERQEYLDGWQRMRADAANMKREQTQQTMRMETLLKEEVITDIIPILDSFDMAMQGEAWNSVDAAWRKGVEYIRAQCLGVLEKHGITSFGDVGEKFDPSIHESIQEIDTPGTTSHTIMRITRRGYRTSERLIRPAQVVIAK
ncbi:MAG: nucleotide exchange factor GrpE [Parcubacteria group bacterium]|nr:nucleotide exchange factor GrpE [Parcubacteria group bacterium]